MPRFHGYICSRTEELFRDKKQYISHLRKLARASLHKKRVAREIAPLRESFDVMRLGATGDGDVMAWIEHHRAEIIRVACLISPRLENGDVKEKLRIPEPGGVVSENFGEQVKVDSTVAFFPGQTRFELLARELRIQSATPKKTVFLEMVVAVLREIPGVTARSRPKDAILRLFAEDWPYVAGDALYQYRNLVGEADHISHSAARILERRYPSVSFDVYLGLCETGMLAGDDALWDGASFKHWLKHSADAPQPLPELNCISASPG